MGKDESKECCSIQSLRYILFIFNFFFWLAGCAVLGVGIWTILAKHHYLSILSTPLFAISAYLLLIAGAVVIVIATIGCVGIHREHRLFLLTYIILLVTVFIFEVAAGLIAYFYRANIEQDLARNLNATFMGQYMVDDGVTSAIDSLQQSFQCCGAVDLDDWQYSVWLTSHPAINSKAPDTCCQTYSKGCASHKPLNHPSNLHDDPCMFAVHKEVKRHALILCAVGLGFCLFQVLGAIFACCMYQKLSPGRLGYSPAHH